MIRFVAAVTLLLPATSTQSASLEARAARARTDAAQAEQAARAADTTAARAAEDVTDALTRLAQAETAVATARTRLATVERMRALQRTRLAEKRAPVVRLLGALQSLARRPAALALAAPGSAADLIHIRLTLAAVVPAIEARTSALRAQIAAGDRLRAEAGRGLAALKVARARRDRERASLAAFADTRATAAAAASDAALDHSDRVLALDADLLEARAADRSERNDRAAAAVLAALPPPPRRPGPPDPALPRSGWRPPLAGRLIAGFGEADDTGVRSRGLRLLPRDGTAVLTPAPGTIGYAGPAPGAGRIVIIVHPRGWTTLVAGLATLSATAGRPVRRGDRLGTAVGPVTIEVRHDGQVMDTAALAQRR